MNPLEMMITIDVRQIHLRSKAAEAVLDIPNGTPYILDVESGTLSLNPGEAVVKAARDLQHA